MTIDVIVPALRPQTIDRLLYSFRCNSVWPNAISIVSNEIRGDIHVHGLPVRFLRFRSRHYPIGSRDVVLRRNIGIWKSDCSHVVIFDDDQIAPVKFVEDCLTLFSRHRFFWGHYRFISFADHDLEQLLQLPPQLGRTREHPPNAWHHWASAYGGLFGCETELLHSIGGFDMIYCGKHGGEDQDLGRRLSAYNSDQGRVFVHEPPFAWHPTVREDWTQAAYTNLCANGHRLRPAATPFSTRCEDCPYFESAPDLTPSIEVILRFDLSNLDIELETPGSQLTGV